MIFDQLKGQFEALVPRGTWNPRVQLECDLAFNSKREKAFDVDVLRHFRTVRNVTIKPLFKT
jgi:hypothetical protein